VRLDSVRNGLRLLRDKVRGAVSRLPGVRDVEIGIMSERLRLTVDERLTDTDKIEKTVRALGYGIQTRAAGKEGFRDPGECAGESSRPQPRRSPRCGRGRPLRPWQPRSRP